MNLNLLSRGSSLNSASIMPWYLIFLRKDVHVSDVIGKDTNMVVLYNTFLAEKIGNIDKDFHIGILSYEMPEA